MYEVLQATVVRTNFLYLTFSTSSPSPSATPLSPLTPPLQSQSALATTEAQSAVVVVAVERQMTQRPTRITTAFGSFSVPSRLVGVFMQLT